MKSSRWFAWFPFGRRAQPTGEAAGTELGSAHPVVDSLRRTLKLGAEPFREELGGRVHQLRAKMVDGRVLPGDAADALRAAILAFVQAEALPALAARNPSDALRVLDKLQAYGVTQLEGERAHLEAARAAGSPPPRPLDWPEISVLRAAAQGRPAACQLSAPVPDIQFAKELLADGLPLPDELLALYAVCDGFELAAHAAAHIPVFSFLPSRSIDITAARSGYPQRVGVFQGGDAVQLAIFRDPAKKWWLTYEYEYVPIAKKLFDLRELVRFAIARMNATDQELHEGDCSWERFFDMEISSPGGLELDRFGSANFTD